jgi:hypothetical protein
MMICGFGVLGVYTQGWDIQGELLCTNGLCPTLQNPTHTSLLEHQPRLIGIQCAKSQHKK